MNASLDAGVRVGKDVGERLRPGVVVAEIVVAVSATVTTKGGHKG